MWEYTNCSLQNFFCTTTTLVAYSEGDVRLGLYVAIFSQVSDDFAAKDDIFLGTGFILQFGHFHVFTLAHNRKKRYQEALVLAKSVPFFQTNIFILPI